MDPPSGAKDERVQKMTSAKPKVTIDLSDGKLTINSGGDEPVKNVLTIGTASPFKLAGGLELEVRIVLM